MASLLRSMVQLPRSALLQVRGIAGTVKWFNPTKGYGFIATEEEKPREIFCHQSAINMEGFRFLEEGERVSFEVQTTERGAFATNVSAPDGKPLHLVRARPTNPSNNSNSPRSRRPNSRGGDDNRGQY